MELIILVVVYNQPDFLEYQYRCLQKFIKVPFRFILFDNSDVDNMTIKFMEISSRLNIEYYRIPQNIHSLNDASSRAGKSLDYSLQYLYNNIQFRGVVMVNDSDLFLVDNYNPLETIKEFDIIGRSIKNIYLRDESPEHPINKYNIDYYSNQFLIINYSTFSDINNISFLPTIIDNINLDCGGKLYKYFKENNVKHRSILDYSTGYSIDEVKSINGINNYIRGYIAEDIKINNSKSFSEIFDNSYIHFRAGSNWLNQNQEIYSKRRENLYKLFYDIKI